LVPCRGLPQSCHDRAARGHPGSAGRRTARAGAARWHRPGRAAAVRGDRSGSRRRSRTAGAAALAAAWGCEHAHAHRLPGGIPAGRGGARRDRLCTTGARQGHVGGDHQPRSAGGRRDHHAQRAGVRDRQRGGRTAASAAGSAAAGEGRTLRRWAPGHRRATMRAGTVGMWVAAAFLVLVAFAAFVPGVLASQDPLQTDVRAALQPPSAAHLFGTDQSGRDVYSRVVHGAARSAGIGLLATVLALAVGLVVGALSGIAPRAVDTATMRVTDILLAFPEFLVALIVVAVLGPGGAN